MLDSCLRELRWNFTTDCSRRSLRRNTVHSKHWQCQNCFTLVHNKGQRWRINILLKKYFSINLEWLDVAYLFLAGPCWLDTLLCHETQTFHQAQGLFYKKYLFILLDKYLFYLLDRCFTLYSSIFHLYKERKETRQRRHGADLPTTPMGMSWTWTHWW